MSLAKSSTKNSEVYRALCEVMPGGVSSPVRAFKAVGMEPMVVERGAGDCIWDVDGNRYIDFCGSWGALLHGHAHPQVLAAVEKRMRMGTSFGITTALEGDLARLILEHFPSIEKIRYTSSGTEATQSAVRLARGYTGKRILIKFAGNFHGHNDGFLVQAGSGVAYSSPSASSAGILAEAVQYTRCLPYNDEQAFLNLIRQPEIANDLAAVIIEPITGNMGVVTPAPSFLEALRRETTRLGALLIYDEVITGFRVSIGGAQQLQGMDPDLTCLGKIIGGGFPAAAFGGKSHIMNHVAPLGPVYHGGTLSGCPVSMEAGLQTIKMAQEPGFYEELQRKTDLLCVPIEDYLQKNPDVPVCLQRVGSMLTLFFGRRSVGTFDEARQCDMAAFNRYFRFMYERGVYLPPLQVEAWFVSSVHTDEHLIKTAELTLEYLAKDWQ